MTRTRRNRTAGRVGRRAVTATAVLVALAALVSGCSADGQDDGDGDATNERRETATALAGCEDAVGQKPAVEFKPAPGTDATIDASMGLNFNSAGSWCMDVFVWDIEKGWKFDHYSLTSREDKGEGADTTVTSRSADFIDALRLHPTIGCKDVDALIAYRNTQSPSAAMAVFTATKHVCAITEADLNDWGHSYQ